MEPPQQILRHCKSFSSVPIAKALLHPLFGEKQDEAKAAALRETQSERYFRGLGSQRWGPLPSTRYITDLEGDMVLNVSLRLNHRALRRSPNRPAVLHKSSVSSLRSVFSTSSTLSASSTATIVVQPEPIEPEHGHYQKGFLLRQLDSALDFDRILECGFGSKDQPDLATLKLTLTPQVIRDQD